MDLVADYSEPIADYMIVSYWDYHRPIGLASSNGAIS